MEIKKIKTKILKPFMQTLKNDLDIIRKKAKIKNRRRPYPIMRSAYQKKHKIPGYTFKSPLPVYSGGMVHYINKDGKIKHNNKMIADIKHDVMSKAEFKKRFYDPEIIKKMMKEG